VVVKGNFCRAPRFALWSSPVVHSFAGGCGFRTSVLRLTYTPAVIGRWVTHALIYLSLCSTVSLVWVLLTDGTVDDLKDYAATPGDALTVSFWPVWFWLLWGTAVAMHGAVVLGRLVPGRRRRLAARGSVQRPGRRHVVAMFTDLSGSTETNERLGDVAWAQLVADHRRTVRELMARHGGKEVSTQGDGFFVRFYEPGPAVECALAIQLRCKEERALGSDLPPVRIGIHQGEAVHGDDDVLGQVVNVAARLLEVAAPHEIVVTEPVADGADPAVLQDRGLVNLKGIAQPRHLLSVGWDPAAPETTLHRPKSRRRRRADEWRRRR
jgi:class 3 adenylate cyclase